MMNCPVCPCENLPPEVCGCPQCGVDLGPVLRLREMGERLFSQALRLLERGERLPALEAMLGALHFAPRSSHIRMAAGKVFWQLGWLEAARAEWRRVLDAEPGHSEAIRLSNLADRHLKRRGRGGNVVAACVALAAGVAAVWAVGLYTGYRGSHHHTDAEVTQLRMAASRIQASTHSPVSPPAATPPSSLLKDYPGLSLQEKGAGTLVSFQDGLFGGGSAQLTPEGAGRLAAAGAALAHSGAPYHVAVQGYTDTSPLPAASPWRDNTALARARTAAVVEYLGRVLPHSTAKWQASTSVDPAPPFPNDTPEHRRRNRTVRLYVSPLQPAPSR